MKLKAKEAKRERASRAERITYARQYTRRNPELSANQIQKHLSARGLGLRRKVLLAIVRRERRNQARVFINRIQKAKGMKPVVKQRIITTIRRYARKRQYIKINKMHSKFFTKSGKPIFDES
jgi:hypothetical protein